MIPMTVGELSSPLTEASLLSHLSRDPCLAQEQAHSGHSTNENSVNQRRKEGGNSKLEPILNGFSDTVQRGQHWAAITWNYL